MRKILCLILLAGAMLAGCSTPKSDTVTITLPDVEYSEPSL